MIRMPPKHVIEKYLKPNGLPEDLIKEIRIESYQGPGERNPWYWQNDVERFVEAHRPKSCEKKSYGEEEGVKVIAANGSDVWERIASALEKLVTVVVPESAPSVPEAAKGERVYTTAEAAELMHRHPDVVRQYCRDGDLGTRDASGRWVIRHGDIERFRTRQVVVHGKGEA